jgi:hypothetical protein
VERFTINIVPFIHPFLFVVLVVTGYFNTNGILKIIEKWQSFEEQFAKAFSLRRNVFLEALRSARIREMVGCVMVIAVTIPVNCKLRSVYCHIEYTPNSQDGYVSNDVPTVAGLYLCYSGTILPTINVVYSLLEDFSFIVLIRIIAEAFHEVHYVNY